jgi:hypothetical protein
VCDMDMELIDVGCNGCQSCHVELDSHLLQTKGFHVAFKGSPSSVNFSTDHIKSFNTFCVSTKLWSGKNVSHREISSTMPSLVSSSVEVVCPR